MVHFSTGSTTELMSKYKPLLIFPNTSADLERLVGLINYINKTWTKSRPARLGTLAYESSTSRQAEDPKLFKYAKEKGIECLSFDYFPLTASDFSTELRRISEVKKADYVWIKGGSANVAAIIKDAARLGIKDKIKWVAAYAGVTDVVPKIAGKELAEGVMGEINYALPEEDLPGVKLAKRVSAKYRSEPVSFMYLGGFHLSIVGHEAIKRTLEKVGLKKLGGRAIAEEVWGLKNFDVGGISPPITMERGNCSLIPYMKIAKYQKDGKVVNVSDWIKVPWIVGRDQR